VSVNEARAAQLAPPRGTVDLPPAAMARLGLVTAALESVLDRAGYPAVRTPVFERFGLLAMRAGDAIRQAMLTFTSERIEYALRPEMTTPVCRLVASGQLGNGPVQRVRYSGPCFRYERTGSRRNREFTQVGAELFGVPGPLADAEIVSLAAACVAAVAPGLARVRVGDIRVFAGVLEALAPALRAQAAALLDDAMAVAECCASYERSQEAPEETGSWLREMVAAVYRLQQRVGCAEELAVSPPSVYDATTVPELVSSLPSAASDATRRALEGPLGLEPCLADRLIEGTKVAGSIDHVIAAGRELYGDTATAGLDSLRTVCEWSSALGVDGVEASLGVARGFEFYTGTVMSVSIPGVPGSPALGGGGRYDNLVAEIGGPSTPAVGFALEVDQLVSVVETLGLLHEAPASAVLFVPDSDPARARAAALAVAARAKGLTAPIHHATEPIGTGLVVSVPESGPCTVAGRAFDGSDAIVDAVAAEIEKGCSA